MVKIDLVTGFLGSGKTTFIKRYAKYLIDKGLDVIDRGSFIKKSVSLSSLRNKLKAACLGGFFY